MPSKPGGLTGRCYCGASHLSATRAPQTVTYCHCNDCRRVSGAPVSAFAAFAPSDLTWSRDLGAGVSVVDGVRRWFCTSCGSPLAAQYDYLPDQTYVPIGLFDDTSSLSPSSHSHIDSQIEWLCMSDALPRSDGSNRDRLAQASQSR